MTQEIEQDILKKLNYLSLDQIADILPTPFTTDAHIFSGKEFFEQDKLWDAFHHFSLTHSTLLYHKLSNKFNSSNENIQERELINGLPVNSPFSLQLSDILRPKASVITQKLLEILPSDWTVIQISSESRVSGALHNWRKYNDPLQVPSFYLSRCRCGPNSSIIMKKLVPLRQQTEMKSILQELVSIRAENKVILKYYAEDYSKYVNKREEVNNRLRVLVQSLEVAWLKHLNCLFVGSLSPDMEEKIREKIKEALKKYKIKLSDDKIEFLMLIATYPLSNSHKDVFSNEYPLRLGISSVLEESVRSEKAKDLAAAIIKIQNDCKDVRSALRGPVILILDKSICSLPFEMISPMKQQPTTRMPSLQSLVCLYIHHFQIKDSVLNNGVNASNGYFVLDPENNLPRTSERLKETFSQTNWPGVTGQAPSHDQFKETVQSKDLFVYVGHGSGSQYMPSKVVEGLDCRSVVMLFGCSSVSLMRKGSIPDPWGIILNYLMASCPCVVGMLWEVMDKDTDLLTKEIVRTVSGRESSIKIDFCDESSVFLPSIIARAKPLCTWYLISAALVVYGLPIRVNLKAPKEKA